MVEIRRRIVIGDESATLREPVADVLAKGEKKVLFNLEGVQYIDSTGWVFW